MRKLTSFLFVASGALLLGACSGSDDGNPNPTPSSDLEPEDMGGPDGEGKFDAWDSANNPAYVDPNFSYFVHQLPIAGNGQVPIPADYWATYKDNLNHEWDGAGSSPAEKYATAFNKPTVPEKVSQNHGIKSATGQKSCTQGGNECTGDDGSCAIPKGETTGRCIPTWWGICHGWAPYALVEKAPINPVTKNGVTFHPGDLEGLMTLLYTDVPTKFLSRRCNKQDPITDPTGRLEATECRDMNAGSWHVLATNMLGLRKQGFVIDATFDLQVWNQPVYSYEVTNPVDGGLKEITKDEAINMLGINVSLEPLLDTVDVTKSEQKLGEYTATTAGEYTIKLSGTGDADLYVKKGSAPTTSDYDCRPYGGTSNEECVVTLGAGETAHYMVEGYAQTSKVQLSLATAGAAGDYIYNTQAKRFFYVEMDLVYITESKPAKTSHVDKALTSYATTKHYKYIVETDENSKILGGEWVGSSRDDHPDFGWWSTGNPRSSMAGGLITYAEVKALNEAAAAQPLVEEEVTVLDNVTVRKTGVTWASKYGSLNVEQGYKKLAVTMTGSGAAELYVRKGKNPTVYSFGCKSVTTGTSDQTCTTDVAFEGGTYFVRARSKTPGTTVTITATKLK
jgi:hypothetical protein